MFPYLRKRSLLRMLWLLLYKFFMISIIAFIGFIVLDFLHTLNASRYSLIFLKILEQIISLERRSRTFIKKKKKTATKILLKSVRKILCLIMLFNFFFMKI
jgi:hypothetical protein